MTVPHEFHGDGAGRPLLRPKVDPTHPSFGEQPIDGDIAHGHADEWISGSRRRI
jgi:hypothetical protein